MLDVIRDCCDVILHGSDDFWIVAALTGCSYETNGAEFDRVVRSLGTFGLPAALVSQLRLGVNGNLAMALEARHQHLQPFTPNQKWKDIRPDLHFGPPGTADEVVAEVKGLHDLTSRKFFGGGQDSHSVADDRQKLLMIRADGFQGHLFQVVFFLQLPAFERPAGVWMQSGNRSRAWSEYRVISGIERQYQYLRTFLEDEPLVGPVIHPLSEMSSDMLNCMSRRYSQGYTADNADWSFSPATHLADAAAAYAIWRC